MTFHVFVGVYFTMSMEGTNVILLNGDSRVKPCLFSATSKLNGRGNGHQE